MDKRFTLVAIIPTGERQRAIASFAQCKEGARVGRRRLYEQVAGTLEQLMDDGRPVAIYWDGDVYYTHIWDRRADIGRSPVVTFSPLDMGGGRLIVIVSAE